MDANIRAVAFDLDGLMFNTEDLYEEVAADMLRRRGHVADDDLLRRMMGRPARTALPIMIERYSLRESVEELQQETDELFSLLLHERIAPMPGLLELLDRLDELRIPTAITTSSRLPFLSKLLEISQLSFEFQFTLTAERVVNGKPHPEIYLTAASLFRVEPASLLVLEDSEVGCAAAVAAGAFAVAVPTHRSRHHNFDGAKMMCESLADPRIFGLFGPNGLSR
jgi:HAD superfamily hydrolase (TIGR01509 family)